MPPIDPSTLPPVHDRRARRRGPSLTSSASVATSASPGCFGDRRRPASYGYMVLQDGWSARIWTSETVSPLGEVLVRIKVVAAHGLSAALHARGHAQIPLGQQLRAEGLAAEPLQAALRWQRRPRGTHPPPRLSRIRRTSRSTATSTSSANCLKTRRPSNPAPAIWQAVAARPVATQHRGGRELARRERFGAKGPMETALFPSPFVTRSITWAHRRRAPGARADAGARIRGSPSSCCISWS